MCDAYRLQYEAQKFQTYQKSNDNQIFLEEECPAKAVISDFVRYLWRVRSEPAQTAAFLFQCADEIVKSDEQAFKDRRSRLLQDLAEYFFENLFEDDSKQFEASNYLLTVF